MLPLQEAQVLSLVGELRSCKPRGVSPWRKYGARQKIRHREDLRTVTEVREERSCYAPGLKTEEGAMSQEMPHLETENV